MASKLSHDEVASKVLDILVEFSGEDDVVDDPDADLFEEGYLDSMGAIELLVELEDQLGVSIAPTEVPREEMNTANLVVAQVEKRLS